MKWWVRQRKAADGTFRLKSFMVELVCAHLADSGLDMSDYPRALEEVFAFIATTGLANRISFSDYYAASALPKPTGAAIEIFDPVNPSNNVASRYTAAQRQRIVEAAQEALDSLTEAHYATTKERALARWKDLFGHSFTA